MRLRPWSGAPISASFFGIVLGLSGLGQAWRVAVTLWGLPGLVGEGVLLSATLTWAILLTRYLWQAVCCPEVVRQEFLHPVQGSTPALLAVSTLLVVLAVLPYSRPLASALAVLGVGWHLVFSLWHTGMLWQGGREPLDTIPTLYLPSVAGNFTSAAALGAQAFAPSYWAYTFGMAAATVCTLKLALAGVASAHVLAIPVFVGANLFIGYLTVRTLHWFMTPAP